MHGPGGAAILPGKLQRAFGPLRDAETARHGPGDGHRPRFHRRRGTVAPVSGNRILYAVNHVFSALTGSRTHADFAVFEDVFPALETINGHIPPSCNREAEALSALWRKIPLGGSDSHTLAELGRAFTEAPRARNKQEFLDALRAGHVRARGASGGFRVLTLAVWTIAANVPREHAWGFLLTPLLLAVPFATLGASIRDQAFAVLWGWRMGARVRARDSRQAAEYPLAPRVLSDTL